MQQIVVCLFFCLGGVVQALPRYYVFGAAEDDCVVTHYPSSRRTTVTGEACLCLEVNALAHKPLWKLDWEIPDCKLLQDNQSLSEKKIVDCENGSCTQHQCLVELYDTQHADHNSVSQATCIENQLPLLTS